MTRSYLPPQTTTLAVEITEGWRTDMTRGGRDDANRGIGGRAQIRRDYEKAAREAGEGPER